MEKTTCQIAEWIAGFDASEIREEALARAKHAVLDWTGVAIAGAREPLVDILVADALDNGETGECAL
ncbi:MAG: MmgE/PrpD family protein, partial [Pseudomonadota bacterium]|nr:MmgE/PrpD family protein [Pseudomonadota bacterium]